MIRLDTVNFTLFELAPVPYEVYMKTYGCSNTLQVAIRLHDQPPFTYTHTHTCTHIVGRVVYYLYFPLVSLQIG
jgi:hypothetical protein